MSRRIANLLIKIGADSYEFQQKAQQVEKGLSGLEKKLTSVGKQLSLKLTAPLVALGGAAVVLADTQAKAETKVQQAIHSTSGAAQLSRWSILPLAMPRLQNFKPNSRACKTFAPEDLHIEKALPILPENFEITLPAPKIKMDGIK